MAVSSSCCSSSFYKELLLVAFDRVAAQAMGLPVFWLDLLLLVMISLTIVVSLRAVGNILVVAMLVTPAATARLLTDRLPMMLGLSAAIGALSGVVGLVISYHANVAAGGTIVLVATVVFGLVWLLAPSHGLIASILARRRATPMESGSSVVLPEWQDIPILNGIVEAPTFSRDGALLTQPGYDAAGRLWFHAGSGSDDPRGAGAPVAGAGGRGTRPAA